MNNKGAIGGLFVLIVGLLILIVIPLVLGLILVGFNYMGTLFNTELTSTAHELNISFGDQNLEDSVTNSFGEVSTAFNSFKWMSTFVFIMLVLAFFIGMYLSRMHPALSFIYILMLGGLVWVSAYVSKIFNDLLADPNGALLLNGWWSFNWLYQNLPIIIAVVGTIGGIIILMNVIRVGDKQQI